MKKMIGNILGIWIFGVSLVGGIPGISGNVLEVQASSMQFPVVIESDIIENEINLVIKSPSDMESWMSYKQGENGQQIAQTITSIVLSGITSIPDGAFANLANVHILSLPEGLTTIGAGAFSQTALTTVSFPDSVSTIGTGAFNNISTLETIVFRGDTPPTLGNQVFYGEASRTVQVQVPDGSERSYDSVLTQTDDEGVNQFGQSGFSVGNIIHNPQTGETEGTGETGEAEKTEGTIAQTQNKQVSGCKNGSHTWSFKEYIAATAVEDATVIPICEECGIAGSYIKLSGSAHLQFLLDTVEQITDASQETEVVVNTEIWVSMNYHIINALATRKDVALTINYKYKGKYYTLTIPAGYDVKTLPDENGWAGFRYIDSIIPGRELTKEEWENKEN